MMGGTLDRSKAYDYARASIEKVLKENPTIEVVIDLHRDGVPDERHLVTQVNGKPTAQLLFYNGLSYTVSQGAVSYLPNPYIEENLAFSFQLEYQAAQYYPDLYRGSIWQVFAIICILSHGPCFWRPEHRQIPWRKSEMPWNHLQIS